MAEDFLDRTVEIIKKLPWNMQCGIILGWLEGTAKGESDAVKREISNACEWAILGDQDRAGEFIQKALAIPAQEGKI